VVCMSQARNTMVKPCGCRCCCLPCARSLCAQNTTCPWCREPIQSVELLEPAAATGLTTDKQATTEDEPEVDAGTTTIQYIMPSHSEPHELGVFALSTTFAQICQQIKEKESGAETATTPESSDEVAVSVFVTENLLIPKQGRLRYN